MAETEIEDITIQKIIFTDGSEVFLSGDIFVGYIKLGAFENRDTYPSLESFLIALKLEKERLERCPQE
jgi:hypothetical protein